MTLSLTRINAMFSMVISLQHKISLLD